jgi:hypothetical protein
MTQYLLWQPWITIKRDVASTPVNQQAAHYLDLVGSEEVLIRLETKILDYSALISIETSSTFSGPWSSLYVEGTPASEKVLLLSTDPNADYKLQRYVRWSVTSDSATWSATFQISVKCKELRQATFRERCIPQPLPDTGRGVSQQKSRSGPPFPYREGGWGVRSGGRAYDQGQEWKSCLSIPRFPRVPIQLFIFRKRCHSRVRGPMRRLSAQSARLSIPLRLPRLQLMQWSGLYVGA